uniref:NADH-ubiquinone oxidoreductase chain 5 n=1 Tax=Enicospilus sp. MD-2008 TaxID=576951 RepID=C4NCI8_9HYME|nr:NADH dehydrogenase subunit 5 [Enicospilus sp. MD-2008]
MKYLFKMMILFLYIFFIIMMIIIMMMFSLFFLMNKLMLMYEFELMMMMNVKMEFIIVLDWISLMFISLVLMISSSVLLYSIEYMIDNNFYNLMRFFFLVMMFIGSMILMIISPNMMSIILGWDGLGLVSYCLVIFYQNEVSFNSGMVTVLTNRIGDTLILLVLGYLLMNGSFNFMWYNKLNNFLIFLIIMISFTKSAQIPYSSWLPKAMAAPTPVSSLVHSSTLVTAGVYLLMRFNYLIQLDKSMLNLLMFMSLMTMFMSGIMASIEFDLKKIIALSTLSQLGLMIFCLSLNLLEVTFFHLLTHAMFKSMLFMCAGIIIHNMLLNQDIRYMSMGFMNMPLVSMIFLCSSLSLMGMPFLSGFFSKDKIMDIYLLTNWMNMMIFILFFISLGLTSGYSIRLMYFVMIKDCKNMVYMKMYSNMSLMIYSMMFLFLLTNFIGFILSWLIFSMKNMIYLSLKMKLLIYMYMIMGILFSMLLSIYYHKICIIYYYMNLINLIYWMLYLSLMYKFSVKLLLIMTLNQKFNYELGWNEYLFGKNLIFFLKKLMKYDLMYKYLFNLMILFYYLLLMMIFI